MELRIEVVKIAKRRYAGVRRIVKHDGIGPACGEILPRVAEWLAKKGVSVEGPPSVVYHSVNEETGDFDITPALFIGAALPSEGEFLVGETAEGEALSATHIGPYSALGQTWSAVFARADSMNRRVTKSSWECYLNLPGEVAPEELRTQIFVPIDPE